jgi:drug/metabolite transporter (DMT)-like permease
MSVSAAQQSVGPALHDGARSTERPERRDRLDPLATVVVVLCCLLWGLNQVAAKVAMPEVPALWQAAVRSVGGGLLLFGWALARGIPMFGRDGTLVGGLFAGSLFAAEFLCIFVGLQYTAASRMVIFIYTSPFFVALGMPLIDRSERMSRPQLLGLLIAFVGVAWAFAEGLHAPAAGDRQWIGDALGLVAGALWGATTLVIRGSRLGAASAEKTLLYQLGVSAVVLTAAALVTGAPLPHRLSPLVSASLFFQVVVVTAFSYLLWFGMVRRYAATKLASFTLLTPLFGLAFGVALLGEPLTPNLLTGAAAVAVGIALVNRRRR